MRWGVVIDGVVDYEAPFGPDTVVNLPPTPRLTPDAEFEAGTDFLFSFATSSDPEGDTLTYTPSIVSQPVGGTASIIAGTTSTNRYLTDTDVAGEYHVTVAVDDGVNPPVTHAGRIYTATSITPPPPPPPPAGVLDLDAAHTKVTPYSGEAATNNVLLVTDGGVRKVRVNILGSPEGSRNGGAFRYGLGVVGEEDERYVCYKIKFLPGFVMSTASGAGGGKMGVSLRGSRSGTNFNSGGGDFYEHTTSARIIFSRLASSSPSRVKMQTYIYTPFFSYWFEWEGAYYFGRISNPQWGSTATSCRWNHWQIGGDRSAVAPDETLTWVDGNPRYPGSAVRPLWDRIGNSRYVGAAARLDSTFSFALGDTVDVEVHVKMNTFSSTVVNTGIWMGGNQRVPNKDGVYEVAVSVNGGARRVLMSRADVVWRYPVASDMKWNQFEVGGAAGGPFEGADGTFDVWDVRYSQDPILV